MGHKFSRRLRLVPNTLVSIAGLRESQRPTVVPAGVSVGPGYQEWLIDKPASEGPRKARAFIQTRSDREEWSEALGAILHPAAANADDIAIMVGRGRSAGWIAAATRQGSHVVSIDDVVVMGPGLPSLRLSPVVVTAEEAREIRRRQPAERSRLGRWSRTIGAMGKTPWRHYVNHTFAVVGCGRMGSLVATGLARSGVRRMVLVDPDRMELHNVGEMDLVSDVDVGELKVDSLLYRLSTMSDVQIEPVGLRLDQHRAFTAAKATDFVVASPDQPEARWLAGVLASAYLRPLLDIGAGVFNHDGSRQTGVDVRLVLPGTCLWCLGGVRDVDRATRASQTPESDWQRQRAGSLRSLNQIAVGVGQRLVEELFMGTIDRSAWLTLEFGADGLPTLHRRRWSLRPRCPVCAVSGIGDAVIDRLPAMLADFSSALWP